MDLKVELRDTLNKGKGLFAIKPIQKDDLIAYYKFKVFKKSGYISPTDYVYSFAVYKKNGDEYKRLIGDIYEGSFPEPLDGIPFWAPYSNEPSKDQRSNAEIYTDLKGNYKNKSFTLAGDIMVYQLVASRNIKTGQEILLYYGERYDRDYEAGI